MFSNLQVIFKSPQGFYPMIPSLILLYILSWIRTTATTIINISFFFLAQRVKSPKRGTKRWLPLFQRLMECPLLYPSFILILRGSRTQMKGVYYTFLFTDNSQSDQNILGSAKLNAWFWQTYPSRPNSEDYLISLAKSNTGRLHPNCIQFLFQHSWATPNWLVYKWPCHFLGGFLSTRVVLIFFRDCRSNDQGATKWP